MLNRGATVASWHASTSSDGERIWLTEELRICPEAWIRRTVLELSDKPNLIIRSKANELINIYLICDYFFSIERRKVKCA